MANDTGTRALDEPTGGTYSDIAGSHLRQKDEHTLARLGKKQVLKVSPEIATTDQDICPRLTSVLEKIWLPVAVRLQLHHTSNLGDCAGVRI